MTVDRDMVELFRKELGLCKVKPGERIGIVSEDLPEEGLRACLRGGRRGFGSGHDPRQHPQASR